MFESSLRILRILLIRWSLRTLRTLRILLVIAIVCESPSIFADELKVPLAEYQRVDQALAELRKRQEQASSGVADVIIGETTYRGASDGRNIKLTLTLRAQLSSSANYKRVPILGRDAYIVSARSQGSAIALTRDGDFWAWQTKASGRVEIEVEFVVPPSGPRGSIEYRFTVVKSPITAVQVLFPQKELSPQVLNAVVAERNTRTEGTELRAILPTVSEVHIVGFHDVEEISEGRPSKRYGQTHNLVSISDDAVEIFSVVNYTILYASAKQFEVELPPGYELVSADGRGAFRYTLQTIEHKHVLIGETAYGIHQNYEISLRLRRALAPSDSSVRIRMPKLLNVERDAGYVAIEATGKVSVDKIAGTGLASIDVRELPQKIAENSVSPIVRAFRYSSTSAAENGASPTAEADIVIGRYAEKHLAAGGVDQLEATLLVTQDGAIMTDLAFKLRNTLRQHLAITLPDNSEVKSAVLDGQPIKPSRDDQGRVLLPLIRSDEDETGPKPFQVRLVYESRSDAFGWFGWRALLLPKFDIPVSSLAWTVYVPREYRWSKLHLSVQDQKLERDAFWYRPVTPSFETTLDGHSLITSDEHSRPADPATTDAQTVGNSGGAGAMPVRVHLPTAGIPLVHRRFWVEPNEILEAKIYYAQKGIVLTARALVIGLGLVLAWWISVSSWSKRRKLLAGTVGGTGVLLVNGVFSGLLSILAGVGVFAWRQGQFARGFAALRSALAKQRTASMNALRNEMEGVLRDSEGGQERRPLLILWALAWRAAKVSVFSLLLLVGLVLSIQLFSMLL